MEDDSCASVPTTRWRSHSSPQTLRFINPFLPRHSCAPMTTATRADRPPRFFAPLFHGSPAPAVISLIWSSFCPFSFRNDKDANGSVQFVSAGPWLNHEADQPAWQSEAATTQASMNQHRSLLYLSLANHWIGNSLHYLDSETCSIPNMNSVVRSSPPGKSTYV